MKKIQQPKKQPEIVKKRIIEQAILLAVDKGAAGISIQNVANGAGITKGGVFHHFENKEVLLEKMVVEIIDHLEHKVEEIISHDPIEYGKFTRAYIDTVFMSEIDGLISPWSALSMTMITDPTFNSLFGNWLKTKLTLYKITDDHLELELIRLATDGLWLQNITEVLDREKTIQLKDHLIKRTYLK